MLMSMMANVDIMMTRDDVMMPGWSLVDEERVDGKWVARGVGVAVVGSMGRQSGARQAGRAGGQVQDTAMSVL